MNIKKAWWLDIRAVPELIYLAQTSLKARAVFHKSQNHGQVKTEML
jgi:hypothetical protein